MGANKVYDHERITVWCDPTQRLIHHQMHGPCFGQVFRDALTAGRTAMIAHGATKWLSDDRAHVAMSPEDEAWAKTEWFPETRRAGWKHWAVVKPTQVVGQMNLKRFIEDYAKLGLQVRVFSAPDEALGWLATITA